MKRSRHYSECSTSAVPSFASGTSHYSTAAATGRYLIVPESLLSRDLGGRMIALPVQDVTHIPQRLQRQSDSRIATEAQPYHDVPTPRHGGEKKRLYSEIEPVGKPQTEQSAQQLAYQALLQRLPTILSQRSIMCAYLRDELREILKMNRLSYHKPGSDNKVCTHTYSIVCITTPQKCFLLHLFAVFLIDSMAQRPVCLA